MPVRRRIPRALAAATALVAVIVLSTGAPVAAKVGSSEHCVLYVIGQNPDGSLRTTDLICGPSPAPKSAPRAALSSGVLAVHYKGFGWTGASLSILGGTCSGGWLNLPAGWVNAIASTQAGCVTSHYSGPFRTGSVETTYSPGGNLTYLAFAADSVVYN
jgi:hypothetical protein